MFLISSSLDRGYIRHRDRVSANKIRFQVILKLNGVKLSTLNIHFHFLSDYSCSNLHREQNQQSAKLLYSCSSLLWALIKIEGFNSQLIWDGYSTFAAKFEGFPAVVSLLERVYSNQILCPFISIFKNLNVLVQDIWTKFSLFKYISHLRVLFVSAIL